MNQKPPYKISQDYEILQPVKTEAYPILIKEWNYIKQRIEQIESSIGIYSIISTILLTIGIAAFFASISVTKFPYISESASKIICLVIFFTATFCGIFCLLFIKKEKKTSKATVEEIKKFMELIEARFEKEKEMSPYYNYYNVVVGPSSGTMSASGMLKRGENLIIRSGENTADIDKESV